MHEMHIGSILTINGRQLKIVEYGDVATRKRFEQTCQRTFAMIKPCSYKNIGKIIDAVYKNGFKINRLRMSKFSRDTAGIFYGEHKGKPFFETLMGFVTSDYCVGMELVSDEAVTRWRHTIGPTNTQVAKSERPDSIRALFGTDSTKNAVHGSDSIGS